jgi:hypothetical protein
MKILSTVAVLAATLAFAGVSAAQGAQKVRSVPVGGTFTVSGRTGSAAGAGPATGAVVMSGRWNVGPWRVLASSHTDFRGRYRLSIKLHRRGILHLRVTPPDGDDHLFVLHVV